MGHRNVLIRTYVLEEITIKLSGALRNAGIFGNMNWPVTHNLRRPKESIEQNVKPVK